MALDDVMALTSRLLTSADALAAMTARLRLAELGDEGDPAVRELLDRVADALEARELYDGLTAEERSIVVSFARSYLSQALDLVEDPLRAPGWTYSDPILLQAQGSASAVVAHLVSAAGLGRNDARILDVGTGVAGLAIAFCSTFPESTVVGIDPWEPALTIARRNVDEAGLSERIALVATTIQDFHDAEGFDLAWLPSFFIPMPVFDDALSRIRDLLRSTGAIVVATGDAGASSLEAAVDDLRTVRSGGSVVSAAQLGPDVPLHLVVGTRA